MPTVDDSSFLGRYDRMADRAAAGVISTYSTSFGLSTNLLAPGMRRDIRNLYAMVRIADEIVDGTAAVAGVAGVGPLLDAYEAQVRSAPLTRFHTDPVLHAYANSARRCHFKDEHVEAFFRSMRRDLEQSTYDADALEDYIYGSAEVIGLLCLSVFLSGRQLGENAHAELEHGARSLGAAFQKINFLRDFAEDTGTLGRAYFPGTEEELDDRTKDGIIADIRQDLESAVRVIPALPLSARTGVLAATSLFADLTERLDAIPAVELTHRRVSVPAPRKTILIARAVAMAPRLKGSRS